MTRTRQAERPAKSRDREEDDGLSSAATTRGSEVVTGSRRKKTRRQKSRKELLKEWLAQKGKKIKAPKKMDANIFRISLRQCQWKSLDELAPPPSWKSPSKLRKLFAKSYMYTSRTTFSRLPTASASGAKKSSGGASSQHNTGTVANKTHPVSRSDPSFLPASSTHHLSAGSTNDTFVVEAASSGISLTDRQRTGVEVDRDAPRTSRCFPAEGLGQDGDRQAELVVSGNHAGGPPLTSTPAKSGGSRTPVPRVTPVRVCLYPDTYNLVELSRFSAGYATPRSRRPSALGPLPASAGLLSSRGPRKHSEDLFVKLWSGSTNSAMMKTARSSLDFDFEDKFYTPRTHMGTRTPGERLLRNGGEKSGRGEEGTPMPAPASICLAAVGAGWVAKRRFVMSSLKKKTLVE